MVLNTFSRLQKLAFEIADMSNLPLLSCEYGDIVRKWDMAKHLCKVQNDNLKAGYPEEVVKSYIVMDEESGQLVSVSVKAKKAFTRMQWFMLEIANEQCLTKQQVRLLLDKSTQEAR